MIRSLFVLLTIGITQGMVLPVLPITTDSTTEIRGFCIAAPEPSEHERFLTFIEKELVPRNVNMLILRVDFNYQFESHPELRDSSALSKEQIRKIVSICKTNNINLIPQINLLGHQSWASKTTNLLRVYPQFDETPNVKMPEKYVWPNADGLYCKSYCPLHPDVHKVVFSLVDEIMDVFEAKDFHAGLDEVFYIGEDSCPRCKGKNKAILFANEVAEIRDHLAGKDRKLWIWGDRLLDGKETGLGMWEASENNTYPAVDMIPKDVMICDWHYVRSEPTAAYLSMKGFNVITCVWNKPQIALSQYEDYKTYKAKVNPKLAGRYQGMMQTIWSGAGSFLNAMDNAKTDTSKKDGQVECFTQLFEAINK
ncbi:family 20 glycosylhydrolase [Dyadobacter sp. NIV53]|uniref:family 20 glycosylhydrolase n=1 Tax=Dyadobacter sp. NIV53 TaxID=2861765 RepID=UPI001C8785DD|nr:family 20 glycosylhydrolase [Dyadobacter sp. NIV53]